MIGINSQIKKNQFDTSYKIILRQKQQKFQLINRINLATFSTINYEPSIREEKKFYPYHHNQYYLLLSKLFFPDLTGYSLFEKNQKKNAYQNYHIGKIQNKMMRILKKLSNKIKEKVSVTIQQTQYFCQLKFIILDFLLIIEAPAKNWESITMNKVVKIALKNQKDDAYPSVLNLLCVFFQLAQLQFGKDFLNQSKDYSYQFSLLKVNQINEQVKILIQPLVISIILNMSLLKSIQYQNNLQQCLFFVHDFWILHIMIQIQSAYWLDCTRNESESLEIKLDLTQNSVKEFSVLLDQKFIQEKLGACIGRVGYFCRQWLFKN
ncbi:unnamed protein product [Paramecium primaurelia]|uniref:Uncharacterized protein n=1 Tax=Paramecium primaurelia TaxID=5886 RepID=A0A8S1KPR3_PARPR|nr:unnamed protein product [Paramecium primaurelia]CAD8114443.1 unnamed protein product [Paramecium primaurelia]